MAFCEFTLNGEFVFLYLMAMRIESNLIMNPECVQKSMKIGLISLVDTLLYSIKFNYLNIDCAFIVKSRHDLESSLIIFQKDNR